MTAASSSNPLADTAAARGSAFADADAARRAIDAVAPMIETALRDPAVGGSGVLCVVVMDPALTPRDAAFDDAVLAERAFGRERARWDADYAAFARAKARLCWEHRMDGAQAQSQPHRLREGDSLLAGGVCLDGIVVGASGAFDWYDEAFALAVAAQLRAIARTRHAAALQSRATVVPPRAGNGCGAL
jgi:hypothetical protein